MEAVHQEAAGRGQLPAQLPRPGRDLQLRGVHLRVRACLQRGAGLEAAVHHGGGIHQGGEQLLRPERGVGGADDGPGQVPGAALRHHVSCRQHCDPVVSK